MKSNARYFRLFVFLFAIIVFIGCGRNVIKGNPDIKLSDTNGSSAIYHLELAQTVQTLTNTFELLKFHGMMLMEITNSEWDYLVKNWHPTNGFILYQGDPIVSIPLDTKVDVPYCATFYITCQPMDDFKSTKVTVRTLDAVVIDGTEQGIHGGTANYARTVQAVSLGEEKVLESIEKQIKAER